MEPLEFWEHYARAPEILGRKEQKFTARRGVAPPGLSGSPNPPAIVPLPTNPLIENLDIQAQSSLEGL